MTNNKKGNLINLLEKKNEKFDTFLREVKKANDVVPVVKQAKEETEWTLEVIKNVPEAIKLDQNKLETVFTQDLNIWQKGLPKILIDPQYITTSGSGASGSASQIVFAEILGATGPSGPNENLGEYKWADHYLNQYNLIQAKQNKIKDIYLLLEKVNSDLALEFNDAQAMFTKADSGVINPKEAANSMRNVLDHFQGNLIEKARAGSKENINKSMQWQFIADKLANGGIKSSEHVLLETKSNEKRDIFIELTEITKNIVGDPLPKLRNVHTQWLDHLYTVLKLINL